MRAWQGWDSLLATDFPHGLTGNDAAWDAVRLYRKLLAATPDTSVTIVTVGFFTNMANLLRSQPDEYSALTGTELVRRKVKRLVSMAGRFDAASGGTFTEFNVAKDAAASQYVFDNWPRSIWFSGFEIGAGIFTGLAAAHSSVTGSPVKKVFERSIPMAAEDKNGRMSWDETAVLVAVRGAEPYFGLVPGKIIAHADGSNGWDPNGRRDCYLVTKMPPTEVGKVIDALMVTAPR
jgi:inosine-uridine nucleoside N-ribohydrolase